MYTDPSSSGANDPSAELQGDVPFAMPVENIEQLDQDSIPMALPVDVEALATPVEQVELPVPSIPGNMEDLSSQGGPKVETKIVLCKVCGAQRIPEHGSCQDCGYYFTEADLAAGQDPQSNMGSSVNISDVLVAGKYKPLKLIREFAGVKVHEGIDASVSGGTVNVLIYSQAAEEEKKEAENAPVDQPAQNDEADDFLPSFDDALLSGTSAIEVTSEMPKLLMWPNLGWLRSTLDSAGSPGLPKVIFGGLENSVNYLVLEVPSGKDLWQVWDDENENASVRFNYLQDLARVLMSLHGVGAFLEFVRPESVVVSSDGKLKLKDVLEILPLPLPPGSPVRGTLYTPPELMSGKGCTSPKCSLYSFGALIYSLEMLHRELSENDFEKPGVPKPFIPRFPDIHPGFGRLISKTFRAEVFARFPTDEAGRDDKTGFSELLATLATVGRSLDRCRLEIASWTTTGMVRTGNEDAFALMHATESRQDDLTDSALVFLADGMGGYEAGEIAAAMTMQILRQNLTLHKQFSQFAGGSAFTNDASSPPPKGETHGPADLDIEGCKQLFKAALKEANRQIFSASRAPGSKRRGMGCTAEAAYIDGKNLVVGHVGDSRVYHLSQGELVQVTRDQTLVNRLVELGSITAEEAEDHPRKNELQQAIGGQPDVEVGLYHSRLHPGDWVFVCSDGLTNHISNDDLKTMLLNEAQSAQMAARRLVNLANIEGATDNATVVVIRCT